MDIRREELLGMNIRELRTENEKVDEQLAVAAETGVAFETWHRRKDGRTFPVEVGSQGAEVGGERLLMSIIRDITERRQAEEALRESEERRRLAQEATRSGTWEWDLATNANYWSEELWGLYGLEPHSCTPSYDAWLQTIVPEDRPRAVEIVTRAAQEGTDLSVEWRVRDADGTERWLLSRGRPVFEGGGRPRRYLGLVIDITDRKRAEQARAELAETLNAEIAHRTKNNLAMAASLLQLQAGEEPEEAAAALNDAASRLLTFASIHEQLQTTQEGEIDLLAAVQRIAQGIQEVYGAQGVQFEVQGALLLLPARVATNLAMIANELITNAAKHGCAGGKPCQVKVRFGREPGALWLSVWNSGKPLPPDFEVGQRARLGLRLVKTLSEEQYEGRFSLRSEEGGTCAEVVVPEAFLTS